MRNSKKIAVIAIGLLLYSFFTFGQDNLYAEVHQYNLERLDSTLNKIEDRVIHNEQVLGNSKDKSVKEHENITKEDIFRIIDSIYIYFNEEQKAKVGELKDFINTIPDEFIDELYAQLVDLEALLKKAYPEMNQ